MKRMIFCLPLIAAAVGCGTSPGDGSSNEAVRKVSSATTASSLYSFAHSDSTISLAWSFQCNDVGEPNCSTPLDALVLYRDSAVIAGFSTDLVNGFTSGTFVDTQLIAGALYNYSFCAYYNPDSSEPPDCQNISANTTCSNCGTTGGGGSPPPPPPPPASDWDWNGPARTFNPPGQWFFKPGGGIASVSRTTAILDTFVIGYDNKLWSAGYWFGGDWHDSFQVAGAANNQWQFTAGGGIAAVSRIPEMIDTFAIGWDGYLWDTGEYGPDDQWHSAFPVYPRNQFVFVPGGGVAATSRHPFVLDTFAIGYDSVLWDTGWWNADGWHESYQVPHNGYTFVPGGGLAAVSEDADHLDVLAIGYDGNLYSTGHWSVDHWEPARMLAPLPPGYHGGGQLAASMIDDGNVMIVALVGDDQKARVVIFSYDHVHGLLDQDGSPNGGWEPNASSPAIFASGGGIAVSSRVTMEVPLTQGSAAKALVSVTDLDVIGLDSRLWTPGWYGPKP
jgi:hypothetical protein